MKLSELVNKNLSKLNPTDLIVWRYILAHKKECCKMSIYKVAEECNVSRTTILRFCKKLSLDGYSDLKAILKLELGEKPIMESTDITKATIDLCKKIGTEIAKQDFSRVNELVHKARRIFVFSSGYVQRNIADELMRLFINCDIFIYEVQGPDEFKTILNSSTAEDLFIIISLSGESSNVVEFAKQINMNGIPLIALTRLRSNTLANLSTENIYVTPVSLPANLDINYQSMLGFFLVVEIWFVSYSQYKNKYKIEANTIENE